MYSYKYSSGGIADIILIMILSHSRENTIVVTKKYIVEMLFHILQTAKNLLGK